MNTHNKTNEITSALWNMFDAFRGDVDWGHCKDCVLALFFLKFVSDVWLDDYEELKEMYGEDDPRFQRRLARSRFVLSEACTFSTLVQMQDDPDLGADINRVFQEVEDLNRSKLAELFDDIDFNSEQRLGSREKRNALWRYLIQSLNDEIFNFRTSQVEVEVVQNVWAHLIDRFARAGRGEFYTPSFIRVLMAKLVNPGSGETIFDPACGTGALLLACGDQVGSENFHLNGQEINNQTQVLCRMTMMIHGIDNSQIERGNTLQAPRFVDGDRLAKFDVAVSHPPFALKWQQEDDFFQRFRWGMPPERSADYAFISHMLASLKEETGRAAVIVSHGVLFRGGAEGVIRQNLVEDNLLDAVIGLPPSLLYTTYIPIVILLFKEQKLDDTILFIDASEEGERQTRSHTYLPDEAIDKIVSIYQARKSVPQFSELVNVEAVRAQDFNLNISRYVAPVVEEEQFDAAALYGEVKALKKELEDVRSQLDQRIRESGYDL